MKFEKSSKLIEIEKLSKNKLWGEFWFEYSIFFFIEFDFSVQFYMLYKLFIIINIIHIFYLYIFFIFWSICILTPFAFTCFAYIHLLIVHIANLLKIFAFSNSLCLAFSAFFLSVRRRMEMLIYKLTQCRYMYMYMYIYIFIFKYVYIYI